MDPRRKQLYMILIAVCLVLSAGILGWTYFSDPSGDVFVPPVTSGASGSVEASGNVLEGFRPPSVFPANEKIDSEILDSAAYQNLQVYSPLDVTNQLGRPNPFRSY